MRALIQRVREAAVLIDGSLHSQMGPGLLVFLGVGPDDHNTQAEKLVAKIIKMRIFTDEEDKMNRSLIDLNESQASRPMADRNQSALLMVVSQFTLYADTRKGNRPSFNKYAATPEHARQLYNDFIKICHKHLGDRVVSGVFAADMQVQLVNDGPVTIWLDTDSI